MPNTPFVVHTFLSVAPAVQDSSDIKTRSRSSRFVAANLSLRCIGSSKVINISFELRFPLNLCAAFTQQTSRMSLVPMIIIHFLGACHRGGHTTASAASSLFTWQFLVFPFPVCPCTHFQVKPCLRNRSAFLCCRPAS